jgi:hypothetical protein
MNTIVGRTRPSRKGKERAREENSVSFLRNGSRASHTEDDDSSPKKRKRSNVESDFETQSTAGSESWVEVEDDAEEEPEFIAESERVALVSDHTY